MPNCYVYEYINTNSSGDNINVNGTLCEGGAYSVSVPPQGEGTTSCIQELSQATIDAYDALGLTLTQGFTPCGTFNETPTPTPTPTRTPSATPASTPASTPTPTPSTTSCPYGSGDCYVYEYINNNSSGPDTNLNGTLCDGTSYSLAVPPGGEGATFCLRQFSQSVIDAYAAQNLILTQASQSCGKFCIDVTPTPTRTPTPTPSITPSSQPGTNVFYYDTVNNKLYITTNGVRRVFFTNPKVGFGIADPTNTVTINATSIGFRVIGLEEGNDANLLVIDNSGVVYYISNPSPVDPQTSFITLTGGTVNNNTITFTGQNNQDTVQITEIYFDDSSLTSNRVINMGGFSLTFSGASNGMMKLVNSQSGNTIETANTSGTNFRVDRDGNLFATSKSFLIDHQTKEGYKLRHGSLEGPENGVYVRGLSSENVIELPEEWEWLVEFESITVIITSMCGDPIYVNNITNNKIYVGGNTCRYFFTVYGERKDISKMVIDIPEN